jgi:hypothetical protein
VIATVLVNTNVFTARLRERSPLAISYAKHLFGQRIAEAPQTVAEAPRLPGHDSPRRRPHPSYVPCFGRNLGRKLLPRSGIPRWNVGISRSFGARPERFELPTFGSVDRRSIQLS